MQRPSNRNIRGNDPPYLPVTFFLQSFSQAYRIIFWVSWGLLGCASFFLVWMTLSPYSWTPAVQELPAYQQDLIDLGLSTNPFQSFSLKIPVISVLVSYFAGPLLPQAFPVILGITLQVIAWALALAAGSFMRSRWAFWVLGLYLVYLFTSGASQFVLPGTGLPVVEGLVALPILIFFYSWYANSLKWSFLVRMGVLLGIQVVFYSMLWYLGTWKSWYYTSLNQFYFLVLLSFPYLLFICKEGVNTVLLWGNNRRDPAQRWPVSRIRISWLVMGILIGLATWTVLHPQSANLMIYTFLWMAMGVAALMNPITSQNLLRSVQHIFGSYSVFSFLLVAWGLLIGGSWCIYSTGGDILFSQVLARIFCFCLLGVTLGYVIYIEGNFRGWKAKTPLFFLLAKGPRFPFWIVYIMGIFVFVMLQGVDRWKSFRILVHSQTLMEGDALMLAKQPENALQLYELASFQIPASPKAHYNQGAIRMLEAEQAGLAVQSFRKAKAVYPMPLAALNGAQLLGDLQLGGSAQEMLREGLSSSPGYEGLLAHNLGVTFLNQGIWDSASQYFFKALEKGHSPSLSYSHLALLSYLQGNDSMAADFSVRSLTRNSPHDAARLNRWYFSVTSPEFIKPVFSPISFPANRQLLGNALSASVVHQNWEEAYQVSQEIGAAQDFPEAGILQGYLLMHQDSLVQGIDKLKFIAQSYSSLKGQAYYVLAVGYWEKGMWGMSQKYFQAAANAGIADAQLHALQADALAGRISSSAACQAANEESNPDLQREWALLCLAGRTASMLESDTLTPQARHRLGIYAAYGQNRSLLQRIIGRIAQEDIAKHTLLQEFPFKEARMCEGDIKEEFTSIWDSLHQTWWEVACGNRISAQASMTNISPKEDTSRLHFRILTEWALLEKDTSQALGYLEEAWNRKPWDPGTAKRWVELLIAVDSLFPAQQALDYLLEVNDQEPAYWQAYADLMNEWGMQAEYEYALTKRDSLTP